MKVLSKLIVLITAMMLTYLYGGTTGKIAGRLIDAASGEPMAGVNVLVEGTYLGAATDVEGYYVILNIPPGTYKLTAMMLGYTQSSIIDVRVKIDQTSKIDITLNEETLEMGDEITVIADRPVVERDVAGSRANISIEEVESIPVVTVSSVVGLQAGVEGMSIRGGNLDEVAFVLDGINIKDERSNTAYTNISLTSVEEIQIQAGGFSAEFGEARSGIVNVITKDGDKKKYNVTFLGRYRAAAPKHFGPAVHNPNSYWVRSYLDDDVCWTGTQSGAWDAAMQRQYPEFKGWNAISEEKMSNDDPTDDLTPEAAQQLFKWQHRKQMDITDPDYNADIALSGPVPFVSEYLGNLRFFTAYRQTQDMYLVPLSDDGYRTYNWQMKMTSDMKIPGVENNVRLMISAMRGNEAGSDRWRNGTFGIFTSGWQIASQMANGPKYIDARLFNTDYWGVTSKDIWSVGAKFTHSFSPKGFHEGSVHYFKSKYDSHPRRARNNDKIYLFGNNYYTDESPFYFETQSTGAIDGTMRMGAGMSGARDSSEVSYLKFKYDITNQLNRYNNFKAGAEFNYSWSEMNYARYDEFLPSSNQWTRWSKNPIRGAVYLEDKLEFEGMVALAGVRLDYSHAGGDWYDYDAYNLALSGAYSNGIDTLLKKEPTKHIFTFSPRLAISYPISENSKLYFNYGHFYQLPSPESLYLVRKSGFTNEVNRIASPNNPLPKTIAYELGYEHNLFSQYLLRVAGYYKDISQQPRLVTYENFDGLVSYSKTEPNSYEDIRGFEITLRKSRGDWFRGFVNYTYMVSTYGYFGYGTYFENPAQQREYERTSTYYYQSKPKPRPFARASLDFFTPYEFGPEMLGIRPLEDWRLNILSNWKTGSYATWAGGSSIPGLFANVQWKDYLNTNIRISKNFKITNSAKIEFFIDMYNIFNVKRLSSYGFVDYQDSRSYYVSLHLPGDTKGIEQFGYTNIPGDDKFGEYRKAGAPFIPIYAYKDYTSITNPNADDLYYFAASNGIHGKGYYRYDDADGSWHKESKSRVNKILDDKSYIDMPNQDYFTFLDPRNIFWGLKISFDL